MEVEFVSSLSDQAAEEFARELQEHFRSSEALTPSRRSKFEAAIAAL
jgi:hypothetical protein